jgi:hypothetical protein
MTPIFLIAGSPGVGKTTIGRALAGKFTIGMHIPVDTIREMVVSGLRQPNPQWGEGLIEQLEAARASVCAMALRYRSVGFAITIDDFWDPYSLLAEYQELLATPQAHKILLYPSQETAMARNVGRFGPGEKADYFAVGIRIAYDDLRTAADKLKAQGWIVVDSTGQSVEETVSEILERTGSG